MTTATVSSDTPLHVHDGGKPSYQSVQHDDHKHDEHADLRRRCWNLIVMRHTAAALAERAWEFAVVLLLTTTGPSNSFRLIASYGITVNVVVALFSPSLGAIVDRSDRLRSIITITIVQNASVAVCAACFLVLLMWDIDIGTVAWRVLMVLVHLLGALNMLLYNLATVLLERDWVVVISRHNGPWLRRITANLKQIDLCCDLVAPSLVSLLDIVSREVIAVTIGGANIVMCLLQFSAFRKIYTWVPELSRGDKAVTSTDIDEAGGLVVNEAMPAEDRASLNGNGYSSMDGRHSPLQPRNRGSWSWAQKLRTYVVEFMSHGVTYARQRSLLAGTAMAMLYLTVLSFHVVMISFLLMKGLSVRYIGLAAGASSGFGVLGAMAYDCVAARIGAAPAGVIAIWQQVVCLTVAIGALYAPDFIDLNTRLTLTVFMAAVVVSRFGLFMFDVAAVQTFQDLVEEDQRGVVAGFQNTLQSVFELVSYVLVLFLHRPSQFNISASVSYFVVVAAALVFSAFAAKEPVRQRSRSRVSYEAVS